MSLDLDAGVAHAEKLSGLVLGEDAGDVIIDHHHFIDLVYPLAREHADGGRAAADPHALFGDAIDNRGIAGLHHHGGAAVDGELDRFAVRQVHQRVAGNTALFLRSTGEMMHAAER